MPRKQLPKGLGATRRQVLSTMAFTEQQRDLLAAIYEANQARVYRICLRILRDPEDAADACQEVFVSAGRALANAMPPRKTDSWLSTVARNHCLDLIRRRKCLTGLLPAIATSENDAEDPEAAIVSRQEVGSILRALPPRERNALWRSAVERLPLADIASDLRINYMAAAQVLSRARRHAALALARAAAAMVALPFLRRMLLRAGDQHLRWPVGAIHLVALVAAPLMVGAVQSSSNSDNAYPRLGSTSSVIVSGPPGAPSTRAAQMAARSSTGPNLGSQARSTLPTVAAVPAHLDPAASTVVKIVDGVIRQTHLAPPMPMKTPLPTPSVQE